ncbi:PGF-pre-PGF domain-containing protein [Methanohalobium sp.]|uniref:PGF-pre-PGF domain-containing protein n=1 Tax=Methanohalobium sp. TaxID=2837493 RepID=UPI0025FDB81B|nr:PGF-pre-PGF domain-containing protein [Methanohalobium sp.]
MAFTYPCCPTFVINYVRFNALKNSGDISTTIEVLNDTSALVEDKPPGIIYRNVNMWVGKTGFATPENIENPVISFKVEKSWIKTNGINESDIKLLRFNGSEWSTLTTQKVNEDQDYIYFESETTGFSPFVITAMDTEDSDESTSHDNEIAMETNETPEESTDTTNESDPESETNDSNSIPGFGALIAIGLILVVYYIKRS